MINDREDFRDDSDILLPYALINAFHYGRYNVIK